MTEEANIIRSLGRLEGAMDGLVSKIDAHTIDQNNQFERINGRLDKHDEKITSIINGQAAACGARQQRRYNFRRWIAVVGIGTPVLGAIGWVVRHFKFPPSAP